MPPSLEPKENTVAVNDGHASRSVLANHLLALVKLNTLILEACNDMLGSGVIAKMPMYAERAAPHFLA